MGGIGLKININMRCIEIAVIKPGREIFYEININMRCIEIVTVSLSYAFS